MDIGTHLVIPMNSRGVFFMAIKGQKFKRYSETLKLEAIRLHVEEKWTYRQINEHFGIQDKKPNETIDAKITGTR
jgi:transposase-like protein